jgi:hypothetical protein
MQLKVQSLGVEAPHDVSYTSPRVQPATKWDQLRWLVTKVEDPREIRTAWFIECLPYRWLGSCCHVW